MKHSEVWISDFFHTTCYIFWSLHVLPVYAWVLSLYSGSKNMHVRLIGVSKIVLRSECERVCLTRLSLCGPVMDWRPVQGVPRLSPSDCWDSLQPPPRPDRRIRRYRKWMDGWILHFPTSTTIQGFKEDSRSFICHFSTC